MENARLHPDTSRTSQLHIRCLEQQPPREDLTWSDLTRSLEEVYNQFLAAGRANDELRQMELLEVIVGRIEREAKRALFFQEAVGYILVDGQVVGLDDPECQSLWMLFGDIIVGDTALPGRLRVLTAFTGQARCELGEGFFVTRILQGRRNNAKEVYATLAEAEAGHKRWVEALREQ